MIRKAKINELDEIMNMYASCVDGMQKANIDQWDSTYPNRKLVSADIRYNSCYIFLINVKISGGIIIDKSQLNH